MQHVQIVDMSTLEANQPQEAHSSENGEGESSSQPQTDIKTPLEATTNASILSASDIRGSVDDTAVETSPDDAPIAENGSKGEADTSEPPAEEPASNGSDDWEDILGNGQLMKKVGTCMSLELVMYKLNRHFHLEKKFNLDSIFVMFTAILIIYRCFVKEQGFQQDPPPSLV